MRRIVFDFDDTIVRGDTFARFLLTRLSRNPLRALAVLLVCPLLLALHRWNRTQSASMLTWIATFGLPQTTVESALDAFASRQTDAPPRLYREAVEAVRQHLGRGDELFVVTGCEESVARSICTKLGVEGQRVLGSSLRRTWGGMVAADHCIGPRKVARLREAGIETWDEVYTDSILDLPLILRSRRVTLVNPSPGLERRIRSAASVDLRGVKWRETTRVV